MDLDDVSDHLNIVLFRMGDNAGHVIPPWTPHRTTRPVYTTEFPDEAEIRAEAEAAKKEVEKRRPYHVVEPAGRSPNVRTLRNIRNTDDVHLEPGEHFQMAVQITEGVADYVRFWTERAERAGASGGSGLLDADPSEIAPLSAGRYSLSVSVPVSLSVPRPDGTGTVRRHAILFMDRVIVRLGTE